MSRETITFEIKDLTQFARNLRAQLVEKPSHAETLGLVARAAGYRNFQQLRARHAPQPKVDEKLVARALQHFEPSGLMLRWPGKTRIQALCLWVIWAQLPAREEMSERQISARIDAMAAFKDAAQIRRGLVEHGLVTRNLDGSAYQRVEQAPVPEAAALIARLL